ncbi:YbjQ family protein [Cellulomonas sp.]|uniref:YbjQ family protein n=1 Tax=Cellulomonas sp. TaxID=40001 RepID=UPI003BAB2190
MIVVTTNDIPGYRIQAVLGEVMGLTVRSTNIGASFTAGLRSIGGGELPEFTKIMYESRREVMHRMVTEAQQRGANAIVAMRFDTDSIGQFSEVCAYGTAVIVEPIGSGEPGATGQSAQVVAAAQAATDAH